MKKRVISWLLTVVMVVSLLPTSVLADTLAADQEQQTQQEQTAPADTDSNVPTEDEETQEQQEPAEEVPVSRFARSGGAALALAEGTVSSAKEFAAMEPDGNYQLTADITVTAPYAEDFSGTFDGDGHTVTLAISGDSDYQALFAKLAAGAVVKNVMVDGEVTGTDNIGGIAGIATNATIIACANKATVAATGRYVGGLVGKGTGLTMTSCYNQGAVSSTRTRPINMGGIAGYVDGGASVENCYNTGLEVSLEVERIQPQLSDGMLLQLRNATTWRAHIKWGLVEMSTTPTPLCPRPMQRCAAVILLPC